jgi:hypothetical protein
MARDEVRGAQDYLEDLRAAIAPLDPGTYRGIACVLDGIPPAPEDSDEEGWLDTFFVDRGDPLLPVRLAIGRFEDPGFPDEANCLIADLALAREAAALAPDTEEIEVVELRREHFVTGAASLGFDVGYWNGDHYSIISDSIVTPTWHPPAPEDFGALASSLRSLNDRLLFPSEADAGAFRTRYLSFPWGEKESEPGEIETIQLVAVPDR